MYSAIIASTEKSDSVYRMCMYETESTPRGMEDEQKQRQQQQPPTTFNSSTKEQEEGEEKKKDEAKSSWLESLAKVRLHYPAFFRILSYFTRFAHTLR